MNIFLGFIVPIIALLFESYPRLLNRTFGVDIWTHLLYLLEYRRHGRIPGVIENKGFIVGGEYDYPPVFISILSRFSNDFVRKYEYFFSPFWDASYIYVMFIFCLNVTHNFWFSIIVQLIYLLTPIIVIENSSATPRSLGYFLFGILFVSMYYFNSSQNFQFLVLALVVGPIILLSHRFTTQGFFFYSLFYLFIYKNLYFLFVFLWSIIASLIVSRGFYLKVLKGHIGNLIFWNNVIKYRYAHQVNGLALKRDSSDLITSLYQQFLKFPPFVLAITNPWLLFLLGYLVLRQTLSSLDIYFLLWVGFSYLLAVTTIVVEKLRFLGEGQRYLELSAFPASYLTTKLLFIQYSHNNILIFLYAITALLAFITIYVIQQKAIVNDKLRTLTKDLKTMYIYLHSLKRKPRLLCIPHQITTNTIYHTGCPVFVNADYRNITKISDVYPYIRLPLQVIMNKYKLDMILLNEHYASISDLNISEYIIKKRYGSIVLLQIYK